MKWLSASILLSALILSYAISLPFRDCVSGYITQAKSSEASVRALAAMTCQVQRG